MVAVENEAVKQGQLVIRTDQGLLSLGTADRVSSFWMLGIYCQKPETGLRAQKGASSAAIELQALFYLLV